MPVLTTYSQYARKISIFSDPLYRNRICTASVLSIIMKQNHKYNCLSLIYLQKSEPTSFGTLWDACRIVVSRPIGGPSAVHHIGGNSAHIAVSSSKIHVSSLPPVVAPAEKEGSSFRLLLVFLLLFFDRELQTLLVS